MKSFKSRDIDSKKRLILIMDSSVDTKQEPSFRDDTDRSSESPIDLQQEYTLNNPGGEGRLEGVKRFSIDSILGRVSPVKRPSLNEDLEASVSLYQPEEFRIPSSVSSFAGNFRLGENI